MNITPIPRGAISLYAFVSVILSNAVAADLNLKAQIIDDDIKIGYGLAIGDVNGDGKKDILLADKQDFFWYENPSWERHLFWSVAEGDARESMRDNVCIAARDIDGDGKVEVAVGTNWNPGETSDSEKSGGVWFVGSLGNIQPKKLPHDPTTHRMYWVKMEAGYSIVVAPLHGRGNKGGVGENGTRIQVYYAGNDPYTASWERSVVNDELHKTHNFDLFQGSSNTGESLVIAGDEGLVLARQVDGKWKSRKSESLSNGAGEIRLGKLSINGAPQTVATIEPMHGNNVVCYERNGENWKRTVLDDSLNQGHALAVADVLGTGTLQVVAGWRNRDSRKRVGIRLYEPGSNEKWTTHVVDDDAMAAEDIKVSDLDGDGDLDLVASGRSTKNVIIYWNQLK
ncbi:MAG: VCBS repeat-containing protein [Opitutales bacterium]|nr:VCBS repeat-containing protein [Opitutales bacterium]MBT6380579.1 VCBS repeat-containing protein [Opitutales bacterium]MBT6768541.1 VCBS repeat-containing protein [Opitutales bacterium]MBT7866358.1 VCBS repeat-containing protein [Opitutales bacterium]